jgi:hypothetical protein
MLHAGGVVLRHYEPTQSSPSEFLLVAFKKKTVTDTVTVTMTMTVTMTWGWSPHPRSARCHGGGSLPLLSPCNGPGRWEWNHPVSANGRWDGCCLGGTTFDAGTIRNVRRVAFRETVGICLSLFFVAKIKNTVTVTVTWDRMLVRSSLHHCVLPGPGHGH